MKEGSMAHARIVKAFTEKALLVGAKVTEAAGLNEALTRVAEICEKKPPCELLLPEPGTETGPAGANGLPTRARRIIAAPGFSDSDFSLLEKIFSDKGFLCIRDGLRRYAAGFDVGLARAEFGVAASGTCMVDSTDEDTRLATMLCEDSVVLLRKKDIHENLAGVAGLLGKLMGAGEPRFHAFITGPSRTADIERVLTLGVHGPLELHVILLEEWI
jgi:L-lactate dehydrogenase complex protein LldG